MIVSVQVGSYCEDYV